MYMSNNNWIQPCQRVHHHTVVDEKPVRMGFSTNFTAPKHLV